MSFLESLHWRTVWTFVDAGVDREQLAQVEDRAQLRRLVEAQRKSVPYERFREALDLLDSDMFSQCSLRAILDGGPSLSPRARDAAARLHAIRSFSAQAGSGGVNPFDIRKAGNVSMFLSQLAKGQPSHGDRIRGLARQLGGAQLPEEKLDIVVDALQRCLTSRGSSSEADESFLRRIGELVAISAPGPSSKVFRDSA
jgi:hypothetical protein